MSNELAPQVNSETSPPDHDQNQQGPREQAARLERVCDYQAAALARKDPLQATLGSATSGLMRIGVRLDTLIEQVLADGSPGLGKALKALPAIETHLRVMRQLDRFAQLELRGAKGHPPTVLSGLSERETPTLAPAMPGENSTT